MRLTGACASLSNGAGAPTQVYQVSLASFDTHAGEKANQIYGEGTWLPDDTLKAIQAYAVAISRRAGRDRPVVASAWRRRPLGALERESLRDPGRMA